MCARNRPAREFSEGRAVSALLQGSGFRATYDPCATVGAIQLLEARHVMAKGQGGNLRAKSGETNPPSPTMAAEMEQRVLAFAEQLGRVAGSVQAATDGWIDRDGLKKQIASVRDGAVDLLAQITGGAQDTGKKKAQNPRKKKAAARNVPVSASTGRSGGTVDARGKTHRKRMPSDPGANLAGSQAAKVRAAKTMVKTNRRRGRG